MNYHENVLHLIGRTPLVRLGRMAAGLKATVLAKMESLNPGYSVKDRIGISMVEAAEREGTLKPGGTIVEATSGNTGIGLALAASVKGYRCIFVMTEKASVEKVRYLKALGADVVVVPATAKPGTPDHYVQTARRIARETPNSFYPDQYSNPNNPEAHYRTTGPELWEQTDGRITHFVSSMGTTGTIMGCSRFFKEKNRRIQVIGCQPDEGSHIPGIRKWPEAYLPKIYDRSRVDRVENVSQAEAEEMTRRLAREEGIFAGISSGGAMHVALRIARELKHAVIVSIVCDRGDRYLSTGIFPD